MYVHMDGSRVFPERFGAQCSEYKDRHLDFSPPRPRLSSSKFRMHHAHRQRPRGYLEKEDPFHHDIHSFECSPLCVMFMNVEVGKQ